MKALGIDYVLTVQIEITIAELIRFRDLLDDVCEDLEDTIMIENLNNIISRSQDFVRDSKVLLGRF
jgi:hypothetical protein